MADFKDMASHPEKSGNIARETLWKNTPESYHAQEPQRYFLFKMLKMPQKA